MRSYFGLFVAILVGAAGCTVQEAEETKGTGSTGAGGKGSGGAGGGAPEGPCGDVPTTGVCDGDTTIRSCFVSESFDDEPKVIEVDCQPNEKCAIVNGSAKCELQGDCYDGTSQCKDSSTLQNCVDGKWEDQSCGGDDSCITQPGIGATCTLQAAGSGIVLRGHVDYEYYEPRADLSEYEASPTQEGAVDLFVTVYDNSNGELLGMGLTSVGGNGTNPGDWEVTLSRSPNDQTYFYFWPMLFDDSGGFPRMALAHAQSNDPLFQSSDTYWSWGFGPVCGAPGECDTEDTGAQLITEADGAGAVHIFEWVDYGIFRLNGLIPNILPLTFGIFWEPGNDFLCGSCFVPPVGGGANVVYDAANGLSDHFDTSINISGSSQSPSHWSRSVINHEFGHWVTSSYSRSPGEGGKHFVNAASIPGLAFSEGWATFTGQSNISNSPDDPNPIYFTKQKGTVFWVDIDQAIYSGGALQRPDPTGPIDQDINENVVSSMLWSLWASSASSAPQGLGDEPLFTTLPSQRLLNPGVDRGYFKLDLVDYFDAMKCEGTASGAQIDAVTQPMGYPYDNSEICP